MSEGGGDGGILDYGSCKARLWPELHIVRGHICADVYTADLEKLKETLAAGVKVGGDRICSLAYADDVIILAQREENLSC